MGGTRRCGVRIRGDQVRERGGEEGPEEGVYVYGLFLEGCRWDKEKMRLADSEPKVIYAPLPVIHLNGVLASQKKTSGQYDCPLYRNPKRTGLNFISSCDLKIEE